MTVLETFPQINEHLLSPLRININKSDIYFFLV